MIVTDGDGTPRRLSDVLAPTSNCTLKISTVPANPLGSPMAVFNAIEIAPITPAGETAGRRGLAQADGDSREMTPAEPKNPAWTEPNSSWAGCPFDGAEAFNVSSAAGYIRLQVVKLRQKTPRTPEHRAELIAEAERLSGMADLLSVTGKKVRERCEREAMMKAAQR